MLAEFLITPDVFDASDEILRSRLSELREVLLPRGNAPKLMVCQFGSEVWFKAVSGRIAAISNAELRSNAMVLFERIVSEISVRRPLPENATPKLESEWISAGAVSSRRMAFDGIVSSEYESDSELVIPVKQFMSDEYCERFPNPRLVPRTEEAQIASLRTICLHSDWMILRLPQIRASDDDEIVTLRQVIKLASDRFPGQTKCSVEIHVCRQEKIPEDRLKNRIQNETSGFLKNIEVNVKLFPEKAFIDRQIFAGEWAPWPNNLRLRRARWLVIMTHVAVGNRRNSSSEPCTWALFDRKTAHTRLKEIEKTLLPDRV